jgi:hypothetical protein
VIGHVGRSCLVVSLVGHGGERLVLDIADADRGILRLGQ